MKMLRMFGRGIRDAVKSVFRNFSLSLASISCITITLIIVAISIILSYNVTNFTEEIEKDLTIVAFVNTQATKEDVDKIRLELGKIANINQKEIEYKSKSIVKNEMESESEIFESVMGDWAEENNPLKDTFQIKVIDAEKIKETATQIEKLENISVVRYGEGMVDKLIRAFNTIKKITYGTVIALILVTIFLIINTIKLTIYSRKREISIMRLVGASNFTIKIPFIIEGMVLGVLGSIIPVVVIIFGYPYLYEAMDGYLFTPLIELIQPKPFIYSVTGMTILIGIVVGMLGSSSAVRKYLKV